MARAIDAVRGGVGGRVASCTFAVPRSTLLDKIAGRVRGNQEWVCSNLINGGGGNFGKLHQTDVRDRLSNNSSWQIKIKYTWIAYVCVG